MTDYFGQVVELEAGEGRPSLDITDDRADVLWTALEKLGYPPLGRTAGSSWGERLQVVEEPLGASPARVRMMFPEETDADGLQDLLDELDYRPDGSIVRVVV